MAFLATGQIQADGYAQARLIAFNAKNRAFRLRTALAAGDVPVGRIWDERRTFWGLSQTLNSIKNIPGIAEYAKAQVNDPDYDVATEFLNLIAAMDAVVAQVDGDMPKDGNGFVLAYTIDPNAQDFAQRTFTPAQTASLRTALQVLENAVA